MRYGSALLLALLLALPGAAQPDFSGVTGPPDAEWRTVTSEHFRVHYPADSETWALRVAARLEAVRERVADAVGYTPEVVTDVVVSDPVARPNGLALPFLRRPRMVLWTSPPGPDSAIGHYRDWAELLIVHEDVHLVHLLRPSRNPLRRAAERLAPLGPVAGAPRWVSEGYATLLEGDLTGSGRPNGDLRAAVLRRWAQAGKLPSYDRLASDRDSYLGMSMAYLAGSAYLGWLEERSAADGRDDALRDLWARLTARERRGFDAAFEGVFGDTPRDLWDRFRAELTWRALEVERRIGDGGEDDGYREGDTWLDLSWSTGAPAVSPDGSRLAIVLRHREHPPELAVYDTAVDAEALEERRRRRDELTERDPLDVPAADPGPPPRERLHTLTTRDGAPPSDPRWLPGGEALLLVRDLPDGRGVLHPDLFRWTPANGRLERLTRGADLRQPDPAPDGTWAVAVRRRNGFSQLVRVDLADGAVTALTEPSVTTVVDGPRLAPDGRRLAYARHRAADGDGEGGSWALVVRDLEGDHPDGDAERELPLPAGATAATPAWGRDGTLVAVVGSGGFLDAWVFRPEGGGDGGLTDGGGADRWTARPLTRTRGAALAPEPAPAVGDEPAGLFFLALEPDGLDLRRLALDTPEPAAAAADLPPTLAPAVRPPAPAPRPPFAVAELPPAEPYGLGPEQETLLLGGGSLGAAGWSSEVGVRSGDLLGRLDLVATGAWAGDGGAEGGALAAAWRGAPLELDVHLFNLRERPSRQEEAPAGLGASLDLERTGVELAAAWARRGVRLGAGAYAASAEGAAIGREKDETVLFAEAAARPRWQRGRWQAFAEVAGRWDLGEGETPGGRDASWDRWRARGRLRLAHDDPALTLTWERGEMTGTAPPGHRFQVGGLPSSLLPSALRAPRTVEPALPAGTLVGDEIESQRAELHGVLPLPLFYARHRVDRQADWLELAGIEWRGSLGPVPLLRLPELRFTLGAAEVLDGPREGEREGWLALTWRP